MAKKQLNIKAKYKDSESYQKHLSLDQRTTLQKFIAEHRDENGAMTIQLKAIGDAMSKDPSTLSKEVKLHVTKGSRRDYVDLTKVNGLCAHYKDCKIKNENPVNERFHLKKNCKMCILNCPEFEELVCPHLKKFPWCCNGCPKIKTCILNKKYYYADEAMDTYQHDLVRCREGINISEEEYVELDNLITPLVKDQKQPLAHVYLNNKDQIPVSLRTLYNYIDQGLLSVKNGDLRRKVTYKRRYQQRIPHNTLLAIRTNRTFEDYQDYMNAHPDASVVQMDLVEGIRGIDDPYLLTLHFAKFRFQIAYLIPSKASLNIAATLDMITKDLGIKMFQKLFQVILTDNGVEFSDPDSIEVYGETGEIRTKVFYCHPYSSYEIM